MRVVGHLLAALLGAVVAFGGTFVHRHAAGPVPWGLVLVLATVFVAGRAAGLLGGRTAAVAYGVGYVGFLLYVVPSRTEGDYLIAADLVGYVFLLGSLAVLALGVASTPREASHTAAGSVPDPRRLRA